MVRFGDVVRQCKEKVDRDDNPFERYVEGGHMDTEDIHIRRWGEFGQDYVGPAFHRIFRWTDSSPQYDVGHQGLVATIEAALPAGIVVTGSPYHGVGIPDIARSAAATAERVLEPIREVPPR